MTGSIIEGGMYVLYVISRVCCLSMWPGCECVWGGVGGGWRLGGGGGRDW